jgi:DNA-binding MarR family transcriptional regulator
MSKSSRAKDPWFNGRINHVLFYKVALLHSRFSKIVAAEATRGGLTLLQFKVLSAIGSFGPLPAATISESLTIDQAAISRTVRQLLDLDLITRELSPHDGRVVHLGLSKLGTKTYSQIAKRLDEAQEGILHELDIGQRATLFELIDGLIDTHEPLTES